MGSTIPTARANLYAALQGPAQPGGDLDGVQVVFGVPTGYAAKKVVAILGVGDVDTDDATLARAQNRQDERYRISVRIQVWDPGANESDVADVDAEAWRIYDVVRDAVLADRTLDGALGPRAGWSYVSLADPEDSPLPAIDESGRQQGWIAEIPLHVDCYARI